MITTKKINLGISFTSKALRLGVVFYFAVLLANCVWWLLSPAKADFYIEKSDLDKSDKSSNYIVTRYPMGVITAPKEAEKPRIVDQVKLTGVYASDPQHSIAFIEYSGKPMIIRQGKTIDGQATLKIVKPTSIVVVENGVEATINISSSPSVGGIAGTHAAPGGASSLFNSNQYNPPSSNTQQSYNNNQPNNDQGAMNDYQDKRRKMMEEIMQKERGGYPDNGNGYNPPPGGDGGSSYPPNSPPGYPSDNMNR
jgi:type II secretory pathway component PulC